MPNILPPINFVVVNNDEEFDKMSKKLNYLGFTWISGMKLTEHKFLLFDYPVRLNLNKNKKTITWERDGENEQNL